jgi:hypothetical protein
MDSYTDRPIGTTFRKSAEVNSPSLTFSLHIIYSCRQRSLQCWHEAASLNCSFFYGSGKLLEAFWSHDKARQQPPRPAWHRPPCKKTRFRSELSHPFGLAGSFNCVAMLSSTQCPQSSRILSKEKAYNSLNTTYLVLYTGQRKTQEKIIRRQTNRTSHHVDTFKVCDAAKNGTL